MTTSLAAGDVNGDGTLDVIRGGLEPSLTLHLNVRGKLGDRVPWEPDVEAVNAVSLGDLDGDGDLDLVCGRSNAGPAVFENTGQGFGTRARWSLTGTETTKSLELGDVDNDGDLDIVAGNSTLRGEPNSLFLNQLNENGGFTRASWNPPADETQAIALGDIDRDGYLDLVTVNRGFNGRLAYYRNVGGTFEDSPIRSADPLWGVTDVALGDLDGDGDLDLVCSQLGEKSLVYRNLGGSFGEPPEAVSPSLIAARSLDLGDADGDGDLDLLLGNDGEPSMLWANDGMGAFTLRWSSQDDHLMNTVGFADLDGDTALDIVFGSQLGYLGGYFNQTPILGEELGTRWSTTSWDDAVGDLDGDGFLDVVRSTGTRVDVYLSVEGSIPATASTTIVPSTSTWIALGDIDADGDLDLMFSPANSSGDVSTTVLYRNDGTGLVWTPCDTLPYGAADGRLFDFDDDGDVDAVLGSHIPGTAEVRVLAFLNRGDCVFGAEPEWTSWRLPNYLDVDLDVGDVNGDGRLDLAVGLPVVSNQVFTFEGPGFHVPAWWVGIESDGDQIVLGDLDGDGDPDLASGGLIANGRLDPVHFRLNSGTAMDSVSWVSAVTERIPDLALGDFDADGDLDLVSGHTNPNDLSNPRNSVYLNRGDHYGDFPDWVSRDQRGTNTFTVVDLDDDGDQDLLTSYGLYLGRSADALRGDPLSPRHQLPNNDPWLRTVRVERTRTPNTLRMRWTAFDVESDSVWVVPEWQFAGSNSWTQVAVPGWAGRLGPLAASPEGVEHEFSWDTSRMPVAAKSVFLRLRTVSHAVRLSRRQRVQSYLKEVGFIDVRRPIVGTSSPRIELPTLTVGDTVVVDFAILNEGNEALRIEDITAPSGALWGTLQTPFEIEPHAAAVESLFFAPLVAVDIQGDLTVASNDSVTPLASLPISAHVLDLDFSIRAQTDSTAPLGEPLTISVVLADSAIAVERGAVYYRMAGARDEPFESVPVVPFLLNTLIGEIPAAAVTESGVEYYVELENSGVFNRVPCRVPGGCRDPAAIPDTLADQPVASPGSITSRVVVGSSGVHLVGREVLVEVSLPAGTLLESGVLHFRAGGSQEYSQTPLERRGSELLLGAIPAQVVSAVGVEYWIEVRTRSRSSPLTDPPSSPAEQPRRIRTTVLDLAGPSVPGFRYRMISVPVDFPNTLEVTLRSIWEDDLGNYDPVRWRAFRYVPGQAASVEFGNGPPELFHPEPGRAYWLITRGDGRLDTAPVSGLSVSTDAAFEIVLKSGWNQIGNPFAFPVARANVDLPAHAESLTAFDPNLGDLGDYADRPVQVLEPFAGYFVYNASTPETLRVHPVAVAPTATKRAATPEASPWTSTPGGWTVRLLARSEFAQDFSNLLGVHPSAVDERDGFDDREPPTRPGHWVRLAFANPDWQERPGLYRRDVRSTHVDGHAWSIEVTSSKRGELVEIEPQLEATLPEDLVLQLVDSELGTAMDMHPLADRAERYSILSHGSDKPYRMVLLGGTSEWVESQANQLLQLPVRLVLERNAPNPFNAATRIRFGLPTTETVSLVIYDVRGSRVRELVHREQLPAGFHIRLWDGTDEAGHNVASGMYFYRLRSASETLTRRLVLVK